MNSDPASQVVIAIISLLALWLPLILVPFAFKFAKSGMDKLYGSLKNGVQSAQKKSTGLGKKAAMNTKYGQAAQQFMGNRKSISALKGREALRGALEKNPNLMKLMGGVGGEKYAARYLDAEQRKHRAEEVDNLQKGLTANVAGAIGSKHSINKALQDGHWLDENGRPARQVTDGDRAAVTKLRQSGYLDANGDARSDPMLATASLKSIMDAEIATPKNIGGLSEHLKGAGPQENALFTETLQGEAAKHGYKNLQYAEVSDGNLNQYYVKGPTSITKSSLAGVNKDALDAEMDTSLLDAVKSDFTTANASGQGNAHIRKIAEQTKHIDKEPVVEDIARQLGYALKTDAAGNTVYRTERDASGATRFTLDAKGNRIAEVDSAGLAEFKQLRDSIKSGGAIAPPSRFS